MPLPIKYTLLTEDTMKRFGILFLVIAAVLTGCDDLKPKPSGPASVEEHKGPPSIGEMEGKLAEIRNKLQNTDDLLIKRTAERAIRRPEPGLDR